MKKLLRQIVTLALLISLIGSIAYTSSASTAKSRNDMISSSTYGNSTIETYEDSNFRLVKYFENDICIQEALLIKDTGDLYYNDISSRMYTSKSLDNLTISNFNYVQKYNVSDFVTNNAEPENQSRAVTYNYSFIRSKGWYDDFDVWHFARLYGATSSEGTEKVVATWSFYAGIAISIIIIAIGTYIPDLNPWLFRVIGVAGGLTMTPFDAFETHREFYWKFMINKVYPVIDRFTAYSTEYLYHTDLGYDLPNHETLWDTIYHTDYYGSSAFHEELVNNIGYYFIF